MLLIAPGREEAIENIYNAVAQRQFHSVTEPSPAAGDMRPLEYISFMARARFDAIVKRGTDEQDMIVGMEKLGNLDSPAYLSCQSFNPLGDTLARKLARWSHHSFQLLYPEQQMWFNYRKPRPGANDAYLQASRWSVPVVPTFMELRELPRVVAPGFHDVQMILHVLDPLFPDPSRTHFENSLWLCRKDYEAKVACYERCYNKPLTYHFEPEDIAGWIPRPYWEPASARAI